MTGEIGKRTERIQLMLSDDEITAIDDWRFDHRLPSRAAAIRELISRGLNSQEFDSPPAGRPSGKFGVVTPPEEGD